MIQHIRYFSVADSILEEAIQRYETTWPHFFGGIGVSYDDSSGTAYILMVRARDLLAEEH